jgi:hypothetical protein
VAAHHQDFISIEGQLAEPVLGYENVLFQLFYPLRDDVDLFACVGFFFSKFVQQLSQHLQAGHDLYSSFKNSSQPPQLSTLLPPVREFNHFWHSRPFTKWLN